MNNHLYYKKNKKVQKKKKKYKIKLIHNKNRIKKLLMKNNKIY